MNAIIVDVFDEITLTLLVAGYFLPDAMFAGRGTRLFGAAILVCGAYIFFRPARAI